MKFKNIYTNSIIKTTNEFVIKQMKKSSTYQEVKETKIIDKPKASKAKEK